jgi:hypothetical protein
MPILKIDISIRLVGFGFGAVRVSWIPLPIAVTSRIMAIKAQSSQAEGLRYKMAEMSLFALAVSIYEIFG